MSVLSLYHPPYRKKNNKEDTSKDSYQMPMMLFTRVNDVNSSKQNLRIIQRHLVYLIGLSTEIVNKNICLKNYEYLGQYGQITKLVVNKNKTYNNNGPNGPSYSCHATYSSIAESSLAILCLDNAIVDNHVLKASYGTTKYCTNFLRNSQCLNTECLYLHSIADDRDIITREQMNNKNAFANQHVIAIELSEIFNKSKRQLIEQCKDTVTIFPNVSTVYNKDVVIDHQKKMKQLEAVMNSNNNNAKQTQTKPKKQTVSILGLDRMYKRKERSRFDFGAKGGDSQLMVHVPEHVSDFLKSNFKKSILLRKEQEEVSQYYFSQVKANEADDSWSSLIATLDMFSFFDCDNHGISSIKKIEENDEFVIVDKFNSV